ncbi:MAG: PPC domain-containing protein [Armatimonadetes bacterium]|nr:PPC domain-containing protein [Armatimonadota bacterium]
MNTLVQRGLVFVVFVSLVGTAYAQFGGVDPPARGGLPGRGGQYGRGGGFGGGGQFGGGFGGGGSVPAGEAEIIRREHILTPGDRGEWTLDVEEGETIIALAESTVFDPHIEVVDSEGNILHKNDDIAPGDQRAQVIYRFPEKGEYKVLVKGFQEKAGGLYTISLRRFKSEYVPVGGSAEGKPNERGISWYRFEAKKGDTVVVSTQEQYGYGAYREFYGPDGSELEVADGGTSIDIFDLQSDGEYYVRLVAETSAREKPIVRIDLARTFSTSVGTGAVHQRISDKGLDLWTFEAKKGELLRIEGHGVSSYIWPLLMPGDANVGNAINDPKDLSEHFVEIRVGRKLRGTLVALIKKEGTYKVAIVHDGSVATDYSLSVREPSRPMTNPLDTRDTLKLGDSVFWAVNGEPGQLVRFEGFAETFDIRMEIFDPDGDRVADDDDGGDGKNSAFDVLLRKSGRYILKVAAYGDGGSGAYQLHMTTRETRPLARAELRTGTLEEGKNEIWSFTGRKGQTILVSLRSKEFDTSMQIFGPDGKLIARDDDGGAGTDSLLSVRLASDGRYTLWIYGDGGGGQYSVRWIDLDDDTQ